MKKVLKYFLVIVIGSALFFMALKYPGDWYFYLIILATVYVAQKNFKNGIAK